MVKCPTCQAEETCKMNNQNKTSECYYCSYCGVAYNKNRNIVFKEKWVTVKTEIKTLDQY